MHFTVVSVCVQHHRQLMCLHQLFRNRCEQPSKTLQSLREHASAPDSQFCLQSPPVTDERACCIVPNIWLHTYCQPMPAAIADRLMGQLLLLHVSLLLVALVVMQAPLLLCHNMVLQLCISQLQVSKALPQAVSPPVALYHSCIVI